jgi:hypothetical protein
MLRWRIARWLVGPFVTIPERNGVWIVQRFEGGWSVVIEADKFRLRMQTPLMSFRVDDPAHPIDRGEAYIRGRFVGTVKRGSTVDATKT